MGFFDFFFRGRKPGTGKTQIVECDELLNLQLEFQARELAFWACVNKIAAAMGRCEVKVFRDRNEVKNSEYYIWNVEPNKNQSSTVFWHRLVAKCCKEGEALIVDEPYGDGVVVADDWDLDEERPINIYRDIRIGNRTIGSLPERDVLHIRLQDRNMQPIIAGLNQSFLKLLAAAMNSYLFNAGQHWKVHINQIKAGDQDFETTFREIMRKQVQPFIDSPSGVMPEFDGYDFEQIGGGAKTKAESSEVRTLVEDIITNTARGFLIPPQLVTGKVEDTKDANTRFLSDCIDPLAEQVEEEINRKRYTREEWLNGNYTKIDTSSIIHFDMFANAANVEKLIGSGAWSVNEVRKAAGYAPLPFAWADQHFLTLNISTMSAAVEAARNGGGKE